jgi:hypothetical protein
MATRTAVPLGPKSSRTRCSHSLGPGAAGSVVTNGSDESTTTKEFYRGAWISSALSGKMWKEWKGAPEAKSEGLRPKSRRVPA